MKSIWRILKATKSLWRYYLAIGLMTVLVAVLGLAMPMLTGKAIDELMHGSSANLNYLGWIAFFIFLADLGVTMFSNISGYWGDQMAVRVYRILSNAYYEHILKLPQSYYDRELTGKIINRLNRSIDQVTSFMNILANNFLQFIFSTVIALVIVAFYSWQVAVLYLALYPVFIVLTMMSSPKWIKWQHQKNEAGDIASGRFAEVVGDIRVVKSFNQEKRELKYFAGYINKFVNTNRPQSIYWHKWDFWRRLVLNLVFLAVYLYIFWQASLGNFTPGAAVALILYGMQIRIPLFTISFLVSQTQRAMADSREYFIAMDEKPQIEDSNNATELKVSKGEIRFDYVSFSYADTSNGIKNLSFVLKPNSKTALVGESGEGKTTITNLLMRLYEIDTGEISIDGQNIQLVTQDSLRQNIGAVFQDPTLFSGTIKENISYDNPKATDEQIRKAAIAANAHEFIDKFKKGYDTEIGERGIKLSGGQKQRVAIARAILKDAPILVLDEATSSLDSKNERLVQQALEHLMKGRTTLIIAHRLSTIQSVDKIVTLKDSTIDEIGSPAELAKTDGIYAKLLQLQHGNAKDVAEKLKTYGIKG